METRMFCFCAYMLRIYMKSQKHAYFHVFSPFSAHLYPPLHHNGKRPIEGSIFNLFTLSRQLSSIVPKCSNSFPYSWVRKLEG